MADTAAEARVCARAMKLGIIIKEPSIRFITLESTFNDANATDADIDAALNKLVHDKPIHFVGVKANRSATPRVTPEQRLDVANAMAAQKERAVAKPPKVAMTPEQKAWFDKLSPDQRVDYAQSLVDGARQPK